MNFNNFEPDADWIEDIGIVGAVNWQQLGTGADFLFQQITAVFLAIRNRKKKKEVMLLCLSST